MQKALGVGLVLFLALASIVGCGNESAVMPYVATDLDRKPAEKMAPPPAPAAPAAPKVVVPTKIIRTAKVEIRTDAIDADFAKLEARVKQLGGYVAGSNLNLQNQNALSARLVAKVPAESLDAFLAFIQAEFKVLDLSTDSEDVSEEYVDVESRLKNARLQEQRLLDLLETKTGALDDILALEREIARVRETIEQIEGRKRFLDNRIGLSTVSIGLTWTRPLDQPKDEGEGFWASIVSTFKRTGGSVTQALASSARALVLVAKVALLGLAYVAPFALAGFVLIFILIKVAKLARRPREKPGASPEA